MGCGPSMPMDAAAAPATKASPGNVGSFGEAVEAPRPLFDPVSGVDEIPALDATHMGMSHLFQQTALLRMFMAFVASRCAEENVLFLRDLKDWERRTRSLSASVASAQSDTASFLVSQPNGHTTPFLVLQ